LKRNSLVKHAIILLCIFVVSHCFAQSTKTAFWTAVKTNKKLIKKVRLNAGIAYRSNFLLNDFGAFGQLAMSYKLTKKARIKINYRYTWKNAIGLRIKDRINLDFSTRKKLFKHNVSYRARYQFEKENRRNDRVGLVTSSTLRNRVDIEHKFNKKFVGYIGYELFTGLNYGYIISAQRLMLGVLIDAGKKKRFKVAYIFEHERDRPLNRQSHIISATYNFNL